MTWKDYRRFVLPLGFYWAWLSCGWLAAQTVKGTLTFDRPTIAVQNNWPWSTVADTQDVLPAKIEIAIATPLTDMNAAQPGAPLIDVVQLPMPQPQPDGSFIVDHSARLRTVLGSTSTGVYAAWVRVADAAGNVHLWARSGDFAWDIQAPQVPANVKMTIEIIQTQTQTTTTKITTGG